jgi:tetratricopeptide (TPR) repeat protein
LFRLPWKGGYLVLGAAAWTAFFLLRERSFYLGDGQILISSLGSRPLLQLHSEPLGIFIPFALHRLLSHWRIAPETTYALISCTSGVIYLFLAWLWAKATAEDRLGRWLSFGILATLGLVQQFFGYVENYSLFVAIQLAYFYFGVRALQGKGSVLIPALVLIALVCLHLSGLMLLPTLALLWSERRKGWSEAGKTTFISLSILGALLLAGLAMFVVGRLAAFSHYLLAFQGGRSDAPDYSIFSRDHISDVANLHLLASPVAIPLLLITIGFILKAAREEGIVRFLLLSVLAQVAFTFFFNPELGAGRDWDLLSAVGTLAFALLLTYGTSRLTCVHRGYLGLTLIGTACLATTSFIALNTSKSASALREVDLAVLDPFRERGFRLLSLANSCRDDPRSPVRDRVLLRGRERVGDLLGRYPGNAFAHLIWGGLMSVEGREDIPRVQAEFRAALERDSTLSLAWDALAETYIYQKRFPEAIACYERHVAMNPSHYISWYRLSRCYFVIGQYQRAQQASEKMIQIAPYRSEAWINLGWLHFQLDDYAGAEAAFRRAVELDPGSVQARLELIQALLLQKRWAETQALCLEAIRLNPALVEPYGDLGLAFISQGKYSEAETYLRKGLALSPDRPELHFALSTALKNQGRLQEAEAEYAIYERLSGFDEIGGLDER